MRKTAISALVCTLLLLSGCSESLPEDELVKGQQAEGLQASSFPRFQEEGSSGERRFYTLPQLRDKVQSLLGDRYWPQVALTDAELARLTGITKDMYVDFLGERQNLDAHIDTLLIIRAKEEAVGDVEQAIEEYRSGVIGENQDHPQNLGKARASRMETIGDYICFVQLGADTTAVADKGVKAVTEYCLEENERAIYALEQAICVGEE